MRKNKLFLSLSGLLLLTLIIASLTVNVQGVSTLDFTFEKDVLYSETNLLYDSTFNVKNQTKFTGHYNATYSFDGEVGLKGINISFVDSIEGSYDGASIISNLDGHNDILFLNTSGTGITLRNSFEERIDGLIEFWVRTTNTEVSTFYVYLYEGAGIIVKLMINGDEWQVDDNAGSWRYICDSHGNNMWEHVKIIFDCITDTFDFWLNGIEIETDITFDITATIIHKIKIIGEGTINRNSYFDAIGYSWDETRWTGEHFNVGIQDTSPTGIIFDDTYFWVIGNDNDEVYQYTDTGVYTSVYFNVGIQDIHPSGITWDGSYFWIVGDENDEVYQYTDVGVYTNVHFDVGTQDIYPSGITWDDTYFWVVGSQNDKVYQYTDAGVYTDVYFDVGTQDIYPLDITWDGSYFWIVGDENNKVYQYTNTGVYMGIYFNVGTQEIYPSGITWNGNHFWVVGSENYEVYKYIYIETSYNIGDNMIPLLETNERIYEPDRWEFYYEGEFDHFDNGDDNPNGWLDVETDGDDVNCLYESIVEILVDSSEYNGLEKKDFAIPNISKLDISFGFNILAFSPVLTTRIDMLIYSYDSTELVQVYLDEDGEIGYHDGSNYIVLDNGLTVDDVDYRIELYMDYEIDLCFMSYYANNVFNGSFMFPFQTLNKEGLDEIKFLCLSDTDGLQVYLDYIGVYNNGSSITSEFAMVGYEITKENIWYFNNHNLVLIDILGDEVIVYLFSNASIGAPGFSPETLISKTNYTKSVIKNLYGFEYDSYWGYTYINEGFLSFLFYNQLKVNGLHIEGVKLTENTNTYWLEYSYNSITPSNNYFRVDSNNRLQFTLTITDDNLEYIQATFNINDVASENRSILFSSNIDGESKGFFSLDYTDDTTNLLEFPYHQTTTKVILPQTKMIDKFTILITDNDLDNSDKCKGYISNIKLIYNPDVGITIITLTLLAIIVPLIIIILPAIVMKKRFGITGVIVTFILMSLICVISNLIPVWLFFIIGFGSIGFLVMKKQIEGVK